MIDLSVWAAPDLPPPAFVKEEIQKHAGEDGNYGYTMGALPSFNRVVADFYHDRYGVKLDPAHEVLQLIGSQDGLAHLATAIIDPGDVVLVPDPGYPIFEVGVHIAGGGQPYPVPLMEEHQFSPQLDRIPAEVAEKARMMVLNYPANPVTATASRAFLEEAVAFARRYHILIVQDFTYSELVFDGEPVSILSIPGAKEVAMEFNSLSKTFNMAGCRIGYMTGNRQVLQIMATMMSHTVRYFSAAPKSGGSGPQPGR